MNKNSLLPKIDQLREVVKIINPAVIVITETKLDNSIGDLEVFLDGYCAIWIEKERVEV